MTYLANLRGLDIEDGMYSKMQAHTKKEENRRHRMTVVHQREKMVQFGANLKA